MYFLKGMRWNKKSEKRSDPLVGNKSHLHKPASADDADDAQPTGPIVDAFREYIENEIPVRLIDTSKLQFVSRKDVFRVFQDKIASITEEQIDERIRDLQSDPFATYQPRRETVLRKIIQEVVEYDILSHRWDAIAGEPTFQDVSAGKQNLSKFNKLNQFCKTSSMLGRKLAWVDTCCIDRTNAAELGEAIHGMYKWYANSYLCIVYLAESESFEDWLRESWFTRGWTLQELLAPKRVRFFNKHWHPFTTLPSTEDDRKFARVPLHLESVTGISTAVLIADNSRGVYGHTYWEIMSWASKRQTTRVEDKAYCLVGLFRVSLTITYGEGERAFTRLVEAISTKSPSWDVFAWSGKPSADHFALPSSSASYSDFEADVGKDRAGVQKFTLDAHGLSMKSLPPVSMEVCSIVNPEVPGKPFRVTLRPRSDGESPMGSFGDLVVECGATRLRAIRYAGQLSVCIINHHGTRSRQQGKLMVGKDYICLLLYSEDGSDDEPVWMKLTTDNLLRISYLGIPETNVSEMVTQRQDTAGPDGLALSLVTTSIRSPAPSR